MIRTLTVLAVVVVALAGGACGLLAGPVGPACNVVSDCSVDQSCTNGHCVDNSGEGEGEGAEGEGEGVGEGEGEGEGVANTACHNDAECVNGATCISPDGPGQCGAPPPPPPPDACSANSDCGADTVCDFVPGFCGSGGIDQCVPVCGTDPTCVAGAQCDCATNEVCNSGRCETVSCLQGFVCPSWTACGTASPDPLGDDSKHGCLPIPCTSDLDCPAPIGGFVAIAPAGFCVLGVCASGPGQCELPVP